MTTTIAPPAQVGDFAVVRHVEHFDDYDRVRFAVYEVTVPDADGGQVRTVRTLDSGQERDVAAFDDAAGLWLLPAAKLRRDEFVTAVRAHTWPGRPDEIFPWYAPMGEGQQPTRELQLLIRLHRADLPEYGGPDAPIKVTSTLRGYANFGSGHTFWTVYDEYGDTGVTFQHTLPRGKRVLTEKSYRGLLRGRHLHLSWNPDEIRFIGGREERW
ncbi:hypothetical protein AB0F93_00470 [Micromonospora tulbaghiae]|uniref:hypothetical protein n=1 Tax=Micromonospora tulbaghiae TaxID=479978 RepID=UPI003317BAA1